MSLKKFKHLKRDLESSKELFQRKLIDHRQKYGVFDGSEVCENEVVTYVRTESRLQYFCCNIYTDTM